MRNWSLRELRYAVGIEIVRGRSRPHARGGRALTKYSSGFDLTMRVNYSNLSICEALLPTPAHCLHVSG